MTVPSWNAAGLLPAHDVDNPVSHQRSPYQVTVVDLVRSLATSPERQAIARGFLMYREALHALGFERGFQWINGSFCTDIETLEQRPPGDIDVVTFFEAPALMDKGSVAAAHPELFDSHLAKRQFSCDAYVVDMMGTSDLLIAQAAYWSSVWGHSRSGIWKGFLQIDLEPGLDQQAMGLLAANEVVA